MRRISLTNLETLCWIARLGTFTAAAQRLHTTQPAVSARIRELEQALDVSLFQKQGRKRELTIQGRDLVQRAEPLLRNLEDIAVSLDNPQAARGIVRIGVGEIVAMSWFADFMAELKRTMPNIVYEIEVDLTLNMRQKLELGKLDLAITAESVDRNRLTIAPLGSVRLLWLANPVLIDRPAATRRSAKQMLEGFPLWCLSKPSHLYGMTLETLRRYQASVHEVNTCNHLLMLIELIANGAGIALLPESLVAGRIASGELVPVSNQLCAESLEFVIARHKDQEQALVRHIMTLAQNASTFSLEPVPEPA